MASSAEAAGTAAGSGSARAGPWLLILAAFCFAAMAVLVKKCTASGFDKTALLTERFALGAAILWAWILIGRDRIRLSRGELLALLGPGAAGYCVMAFCYFTSVQRLPASTAALLLYTYPPLTAVLSARFGGEKVGARQWIAIALAVGGVALVLKGAHAGTSGQTALDPLGVACALCAAAVYAGYLVLCSRKLRNVPPRLSSAVVASAAAAVFAGIAIFRGVSWSPAEPVGWGWLGLLVLLSTVIGMQAFFAGARRTAPSRAAVLGTAEPVFAVALSAVTLGESLTIAQMAGGIVIIAAVLLSRKTESVSTHRD